MKANLNGKKVDDIPLLTAALHYDKAQNPLKALKLYEEAGEDFI